jgi:tetratricopeptide (TPR) repeat protein
MNKLLLFIQLFYNIFLFFCRRADGYNIGKNCAILHNNKEWAKAIDAYKILIEKDKYNGAFLTNLASAYYNNKNYPEAIKNL